MRVKNFVKYATEDHNCNAVQRGNHVLLSNGENTATVNYEKPSKKLDESEVRRLCRALAIPEPE